MKTPLTREQSTSRRRIGRYVGDRSAGGSFAGLAVKLLHGSGPAAAFAESTPAGAGPGPLTARAAANIAEWSSYLPPDCVAAMIRDGWHHSV